ncbi:bifunctional hydroxymethylpyrimidine kinase/phosphomethylpyrimidine kinase [Halosegnis sp.]|uniref:bifunctional hydroxymethylpyrimidine kinase/phosphomethylpyrimidine kinase n=1 Tax=Halosegnis sp. TaxID=2864959 RepID=UPI0035D46CEC
MTSGGQPPSPVDAPVALTVAGSDSGGGAGVQADIKTMEAMGAFATSVLTAVTAQSTTGVDASHVLPLADIRAQYETVTADFDVRAAKTGMLATAEVVERVARWVREAPFPVVVDPVMVAESGDRLLTTEAEDAYEQLVAAATLVTPNTEEAAVLTGIEPTTPDEQAAAGERLLNAGAGAALITGGHAGGETVTDVLVTPDGMQTFEQPRVATDATHGSGCTLSSAVTAHLAQGVDLTEAVEQASAFTARAVQYAHDVGEGTGPVHHLVALRDEAARPATRETVETLATRLADHRGVAGATPYAASPEDVVTVGDDANLAAALATVRERAPSVRFAVATPPAVAAAARTVDEIDLVESSRAVDGSAVVVRDGSVGRFFGADPDALASAVLAALAAVE